MELTLTEYQHCDLVKIIGRIDSYTAPKIDQALQALITDDHQNIVVDMEDVVYISSSGMLVFVHLQKQLKNQNRGEIVFANVPKLVFSSFELSGFNHLFGFYKDVVSAVGRF